jgi:hypothetical protein
MPSERQVVDHIVAKHDPEAVILVGSRADGRARRGSDWDLYVLLPPDASVLRGVVPAPDALDGELLDVALVRLPIDDVGGVFGPNLQQARVLKDNASGDAARLCADATALYARGRRLRPEEIERRRHELARNIARMEARSDEAGPFFEALAYVFYAAHRSWYEVLRDRWSVSVHRAMPEIAREDPAFHDLLVALVEGPSAAARIDAARRIFRALFEERARNGSGQRGSRTQARDSR